MESVNLFKGYGKVTPTPEEDPSSLSTRRAAHTRRLTIALSLTLLLTLILLSSVAALIHATNSERHSHAPPPSSDSLKTVCAVTQHPDSCFNSISPLLHTPLPKPDPVHYLNLSLHVAINEFSVNVSSLPNALISKVNDAGTVSALKDCASLFDDALSQLNQSAELLTVDPALTETKVSNMQTWISAAMTDQDTCLEGLGEMESPLIGEVKARVQGATECMSNTLAILSHMPSLLHKFGITMH